MGQGDAGQENIGGTPDLLRLDSLLLLQAFEEGLLGLPFLSFRPTGICF
jgi:hypothetical protein